MSCCRGKVGGWLSIEHFQQQLVRTASFPSIFLAHREKRNHPPTYPLTLMPAFSATSMASMVPLRSVAMGFSQKTCLPIRGKVGGWVE